MGTLWIKDTLNRQFRGEFSIELNPLLMTLPHKLKRGDDVLGHFPSAKRAKDHVRRLLKREANARYAANYEGTSLLNTDAPASSPPEPILTPPSMEPIRPTASTQDILLEVGDGPEGFKVYIDEERGVVDWANSFPPLYIEVSTFRYNAKFGPFDLSASLVNQLKEKLNKYPDT